MRNAPTCYVTEAERKGVGNDQLVGSQFAPAGRHGPCAVVGWEREASGKPAGLRTHTLVALGSALFVVSAMATALVHDERWMPYAPWPA